MDNKVLSEWDIDDLQSKIIMIYGPTASGKSAFALRLAQSILAKKNIGCEIINVDSQQIYSEIPIITAQPSAAERESCQHHMYGFVPYEKRFDVRMWLDLALEKIKEVRLRGHIPVFVGGTGMYIRSLQEGLFDMPKIDSAAKKELEDQLLQMDNESLFERLQSVDPQYCSRVSINDRVRIIRGIIVATLTDVSMSMLNDHRDQNNLKVFPPKTFINIYIKPHRDVLYQTISERFGKMLEDGGVAEVQALMQQYPDSDFKKATGVREIVAYLKGEISKDEMIDLATKLTRNYAKRQYTWFNNQIEADLLVEQPELF